MGNWALYMVLSVMLLPALVAVGLILRTAVLRWGSFGLGIQARILGAAEQSVHAWLDQKLTPRIPSEGETASDMDKAA